MPASQAGVCGETVPDQDVPISSIRSGSLRDHREAFATMDFFAVPTITFGILYGFFVISHRLFAYRDVGGEGNCKRFSSQKHGLHPHQATQVNLPWPRSRSEPESVQWNWIRAKSDGHAQGTRAKRGLYLLEAKTRSIVLEGDQPPSHLGQKGANYGQEICWRGELNPHAG
jgi:hypothetical protein